MESSQFSKGQSRFETIEQLDTRGATCDSFRVKLYGKLHFLKRLKPEFAGDIRYQEALRKEFETGYRLEHPNLVRYVSLDGDSILMEYVDGETLAQRLTQNPDYFSVRKNTEKFVRQLLSALEYLHSHQVLHLDLKPDNILLTHINDDVKLIDLGFCRTDAFVDTQGYTSGFAAPEQLAENQTQLPSSGEAGNLTQFPSSGEEGQGVEATINVPTDIYAFGKILECLPDHRRYNKVIARCTATAPAARYQSIEEILSDINRRQHYSRYVAAILAIVVVLALAIGIALLTHRENATPEMNEMPEDSVVQIRQDSIVQEDSGEKYLEKPESVGALDSVLQNNGPVPMPTKIDVQAQMKADLDKMIDQAYRSTIVTFCDSVFPPRVNYPGNPWKDASIKFHDQVVGIGDRLVKKYPNIPESVIRQETEMRFQGLVTYVFDKMRKNANP